MIRPVSRYPLVPCYPRFKKSVKSHGFLASILGQFGGVGCWLVGWFGSNGLAKYPG